MSFAFNAAPAPAAAPAAGGFAFGAAPPAPAAGGLFGAAPAAASAFGAAPAAPAFGAAPAPGAFGAAPAPGAFGAAPAAPAFGAAPSPGAFGAAPAAPAFGAAPAPGAFGAAPAAPAFGAAPAPGAFGASPAAGGLFGAAPGAFGAAPATPGAFGAPAYGASPAQQQQQPQGAVVAGSTAYASLAPEYRRAIDELHQAMMQHKRSMNHVQAMAPQVLVQPEHAAAPTAAATLLQTQMASLHRSVVSLEQELKQLQVAADVEKKKSETATQQAYMYGRWPVEAVAVRRGVRLQQHHQEEKKDAETADRVRQLLDQQMVHVDRVERMPSPYLWQVLDDMQRRLQVLQQQAANSTRQVEQSVGGEQTKAGDIVFVVETQNQALWQLSSTIARVHSGMEMVRHKYRFYEREDNVLLQAEHEERERERKLDDQIQRMYVQASQAPAPGAPVAGVAPAPVGGGLFGATPAPAASGFGFAGAPAPVVGGGLFGAAPAPPGAAAPAPAAGGLFGAVPAAAPAAGGLFGATPAVPGVAAPAPSFGNFGSTSATFSATPKKKSGSRSSGRLNKR